MDEFMNVALDEARAGAAEGGIPIGAALAEGNRSESQTAGLSLNNAC